MTTKISFARNFFEKARFTSDRTVFLLIIMFPCSQLDLPTEEETYEFFTRVWEKTEDKDAGEESETAAAAAAPAAGSAPAAAGAADGEDARGEEDRQRQEVQFYVFVISFVCDSNLGDSFVALL